MTLWFKLLVFISLGASLVSVFSGCNTGDQADLGTVHGTITQNGEPLAGAWVEFFPEFDARPFAGRSDANGSFQLEYTSTQPGVKAGMYTVKIGVGGTRNEDAPLGTPDQPKLELFQQTHVEVKAGKNKIEFTVPDKIKK